MDFISSIRRSLLHKWRADALWNALKKDGRASWLPKKKPVIKTDWWDKITAAADFLGVVVPSDSMHKAPDHWTEQPDSEMVIAYPKARK